MKYSNIIGIAAAALLVYACTLTWISVPAHNIRISGFHSEGNTQFGRPGMLHVYFSAFAVILFLIPRLWAKRVNVFFCAINMAWALANFYRIGVICRSGDCPEKEAGLYLTLAASVLMFIMSVLPKLEIKSRE